MGIGSSGTCEKNMISITRLDVEVGLPLPDDLEAPEVPVPVAAAELEATVPVAPEVAPAVWEPTGK